MAATAKAKSKRSSDLEEGGETMPLLPKTTAGEEKGIMERADAKFVSDIKLATRGAFAVLVVGMPFFLPKGSFPTIDHAIEHGLYSSSVVIYLMLTLYTTVGQTINNAWCGILGTLLATLNIWILFGIFPEGVTATSRPEVFWVAVAEGILFVVLMLLLNLPLATSIFGIATFVGYWMEFLDEGEDYFNKGFAISLDGTAVRGMLACTLGCVVAIIVSLLPTPLWAMTQARATADRITKVVQSSWYEAARFYCEAEANANIEGRFLSKLEGLAGEMTALNGHIQNAWWECFGLGKTQVSRRMLLGLDSMLHQAHDGLMTTMSICVSETGFGPQHEQIAKRIRPAAMQLVQQACHLLQQCVDAAKDGVLDDYEVAEVQKMIQQVCTTTEKFTNQFHEGMEEFTLELVDEHVFCRSLQVFSRLCTDYAQELLANRDGRQHPDEGIKVGSLVASVFDPASIFESKHFGFAVRNSTTVLMGFFVGYRGWGQTLAKHSPAVAVTCAVLMSKFIGSAMQNNLNRVQGVILGTVTGQLMFAFLGQCSWYVHFVMIISIFSWGLCTLFLYYNSTQYSGIGCMLAIFGTMNMLKTCRNSDVPLDTVGSYQAVLYVVLAIGIIIFVDAMIGSKRASLQAFEDCQGALTSLKAAIAFNFDPKEMKTRFHKGKILGQISAAETLGKEASLEPRFWRIPWKGDAFNKACKAMYGIRQHITTVEFVMAENHQNGGPKNNFMVKLLTSPAANLPKLAALAQEKTSQVEGMIKLFTHEQSKPHDLFQSKDMNRDYMAESLAISKRLIEEDLKALSDAGAKDDVRRDNLCRLSVVIACLQKVQEHLSGLQQALIRG